MTMRRGAINDALERGDTRWLLHWIGAERQLTHDPNPALARHAATLSLTSGPVGAVPTWTWPRATRSSRRWHAWSPTTAWRGSNLPRNYDDHLSQFRRISVSQRKE